MELRAIGSVASPLTDPAEAPKQGREGAPAAWLRFDPAVGAGLRDVRVGDELLVITWLDRARRDLLVVHPRDDADAPERGVFSTRSADRPNPLGLHPVTVVEVDGTDLLVEPIEALDGTPIVDLKPVLGPA